MKKNFSSQSTDSVRELLNLANCSLLISTYQAGQLVVVRPQNKGINTHFMGFNRPMGIALKNNEFALGGQSSITVFRNLAAAGVKTGQGDHVDACYMPRKIHLTGEIDVHEMGYDKHGQLWFINTKMSCLSTLDEAHSFLPKWRPEFISAYDLSDRCHLNGLAFRDGKPKYVTLLGAYDSPGGWRNNKVSGGQIIDIENNNVLAKDLCMPHSPRWYRNKLYFLSSGTGQLMALTPGHAPEVVSQLPGFVRGMDFIDRYALIGLSQVRESSTFAGLPLTKRVEKRESGVWIVDLDSGNTVGFLVFTGHVQEVFDVKVLPHKFASIVNETNPLINSSYELPDTVLSNLAPVDPTEVSLEQTTQLHMEAKFDEAIAGYKSIIKHHPKHRQANHQLGICLVDVGYWQQAIDHLTQVISQQPDNAEAMNSLGLAHSEMFNLDQAIAWFDQSIQTDNQIALAHFNRAMLLLKKGQYTAGWEAYDWRWKTPQFVRFQCNKPQWKGEDISDLCLLVHSEQGHGDHIQFMRFLPLVAKLCKKLIYVGPENMAPLVAQIPGVTESRVPGQIPEDHFAVWSPLLSLPRWLEITLDNLPAPQKYLNIPPQTMVSELTGQFKVGVAWSGSPGFKKNSTRSIPLNLMTTLFDIKGITFYALQMPLNQTDRETLKQYHVINLEPELPGYARTAALIDQLDLVISVDTAVSHVAAALGVKTWTLLAANADWRWLETGNTSPWYPSITLYRQTQENPHWPAVLNHVKKDLINSLN